MPVKIDHDPQWIREFRALVTGPRVTWDVIAGRMGCSRNHGIEMARRLTLKRRPPTRDNEPVIVRATEEPHHVFDDCERTNGALRPGHPFTWGLITAGTLLDGAPYR